MPLTPGTTLGPYEILGLLGVGGMGEVYRARDPRLQRDVAVKVMPEEFAKDSERLRRFEQESRAAGALQHPNVVAVLDVGVAGDTRYVVQELLDGRNLRDTLAAGPLTVRRVIDLLTQAASGLAAAHEKGIVHRDLKPENLFVCSDGRLKILDFGVARVTQHASTGGALSHMDTGTSAGLLLGTVGYMSPEQARGETVDVRSDLFALGAIGYELLAGKRAFAGATHIDTLSAILNKDPEPLPSGVPAPLARLVMRCLEKEPAHRFGSARDLAFSLEALGDAATSTGDGPAAAAVAAMQAKRPARRGPGTALWVLIGSLVGAALGFWVGRVTESPMVSMSLRTHAITFAPDLNPTASPDGRLIAFSSWRGGVRRIWVKDLTSGGEYARSSGPDWLPRFSPDGTSLLYSHADIERQTTSIYRIPVLGGEPRKILDDAADADWSPHGDSIVCCMGGDVTHKGAYATRLVIVSADGNTRRVLCTHEGVLAGPRWAPDGKHVSAVLSGFANTANRLLIADLAGRVKLVELPRGGGLLSSGVWIDGGAHLVAAIGDGTLSTQRGGSSRLYVFNADGSRVPREIGDLGFSTLVIDALPDGRIVSENTIARENLCQADLVGGRIQVKRWLTQGAATDRQPTISPDGKWVMFSSNRAGNVDLWEVSLDNGEMRQITDDRADDWDPAYTPDGRQILWSSNRTGSFEIWAASRDGTGARQVTRDSVDAENPTLGADGWIYYMSLNPRPAAGVKRIRLDGSQVGVVAESPTAQIPEVSPDGRYVAFGEPSVSGQSDMVIHPTTPGSPPALRMNTVVLQGTSQLALARGRWMPDGRTLVYAGSDENGTGRLFWLPFVPGAPAPKPSRLEATDDGFTETFGIARDGKTFVLGRMQNESGIQVTTVVPEVARGRGAKR